MADTVNSEKPLPSAPPTYSSVYPAGQTEPAQYGFQQPAYPPYPQPYPPQPQPAYFPPPQTTQPISTNQQTVVVMGGCPTCRVGILEDSYTCCGILCAICFFPIGIICCLCLKEKKCTNCKSTF